MMLNPNMYGCAFYDMATSGKERIGLSSMFYLRAERSFFDDAIHRNLAENRAMQIRMVFDYNRSQRGALNANLLDLGLRPGHLKSSQSVYNGLSQNIQIGLFKCPIRRKPLRRVEDLPLSGAREIFGVQHFKIMVSDNNVVLLGGNQKMSFYKSKQDRAWIIRDCKPFADYCWDVLAATYDHSYKLT
jgi:phosphatidylserine/phosphatidylglycerophosphate/cardiolipin synthase-like enzyme